jgi:hypothetical protein
MIISRAFDCHVFGAISSGSLIDHPTPEHHYNSEWGEKQTPISQAFLDAPEAER